MSLMLEFQLFSVVEGAVIKILLGRVSLGGLKNESGLVVLEYEEADNVSIITKLGDDIESQNSQEENVLLGPGNKEGNEVFEVIHGPSLDEGRADDVIHFKI